MLPWWQIRPLLATANNLEDVLRLLDARTGSQAELRPSRPGLLRVCVHVPLAATAADITALRVLLAADLLMRAAELRRLQVLTALEPSHPASSRAALAGWADALGIHPPSERASFHDARPGLASPVDVHLASEEARLDARQGEPVVRIAAAHLAAAGSRAGAAAESPLASQEHDSLDRKSVV